MYHTLTPQATIDLVESNPDLKQFIRELAHKFNVYAMCHDPSMIHDAIKFCDDHDLPQERKDKKVRNATRIMMTKENGMAFGVAFIGEGGNRAGASVTEYGFVSRMVHKEKGRGSDRHMRTSINIKALIKTLQKDYDERSQEADPVMVVLDNLWSNLRRSADSIAKVGWHDDHVSISNRVAREILLEKFESKALSQEALDDLQRLYTTYLKTKDKRDMSKEISDRFMGDCYLVTRMKHCPAVMSRVLITKEIRNNEAVTKITLHDGVKSYSSMDDLASDYPNLAVSIKMFNTKHDVNKNLRFPNLQLFPIGTEIPHDFDKLDNDLDVFSDSQSVMGYGSFSEIGFLLIPIIKYE